MGTAGEGMDRTDSQAASSLSFQTASCGRVTGGIGDVDVPPLYLNDVVSEALPLFPVDAAPSRPILRSALTCDDV